MICCSFILASVLSISLYYRQIYYFSFQCSSYISHLLSRFHFMFSSFHVCTCLSASDGPWFFTIRVWGNWQATVRRNPGRLPCVSPKFLVHMYFGILSCYDNPTPKLYHLYFYFCYFLSLVSRQRLLIRCMSYMWKWNIWLSFVYVCENLAPLLQRKVFTKRLLSLYVPVGHYHIHVLHILWSGGWHGFVGIRARFILHHKKTIRFTYKKEHP